MSVTLIHRSWGSFPISFTHFCGSLELLVILFSVLKKTELEANGILMVLAFIVRITEETKLILDFFFFIRLFLDLI